VSVFALLLVSSFFYLDAFCAYGLFGLFAFCRLSAGGLLFCSAAFLCRGLAGCFFLLFGSCGFCVAVCWRLLVFPGGFLVVVAFWALGAFVGVRAGVSLFAGCWFFLRCCPFRSLVFFLFGSLFCVACFGFLVCVFLFFLLFCLFSCLSVVLRFFSSLFFLRFCSFWFARFGLFLFFVLVFALSGCCVFACFQVFVLV